jgi:PKD repeat protein
VTVTSGSSQVEAGSTQATALTVTAKKADGSPVADGTEVVVNTSLGYFSLDGAGQPVQQVKQTLAGGSTMVSYFPGKVVGTANILAQVGTSAGKLNLAVVEAAPPPVAPVAEFAFEVSALSALFADMSTGNPTAWSWDFGDGDGTNRQNPLHTYAVEGTYTVSLTVTAPGGTSMKRKFVTVTAGEPLIANFGYTVNGLNVLFADASAGKPTSWSWDFGDGKRSSEKNPSHSYTQAGSYAVSLTVTNAFGVSDSTSQFVSLSLGDPPVADFQVQTDGLRALFTDASMGGKPTKWSWDFGDGATSTAQNPSHVYAQAGTYNVTLTASNAAGSSSKTKFATVSLGDPPKADFELQVNGLNVVFLDASTGKPTNWSWSFGDGSSSTAQNPSHTYAQAGTYTVSLTASNAAGSSTKAKLVTVSLGDAPTANFEFQVNGLSVSFVDRSTGKPTSWRWDFGDGSTSNAQNPSHGYAQAGTYTVSLTASNAGGSNTVAKLVTLTNTARPTAGFCYQRQGMSVVFTDTSTQSPTSWVWNFGDCSTSPATCQSSLQNPSHTYTANASYAVTLTASNSAGSGSRSIFLGIDGGSDASPVCGN